MSALVEFRNLVAGEAVEPADWLESIDPFTTRPWARIPRDGAAQVDAAVAAAQAAFRHGEWATMTPSRRGLLLHRLADLIAEQADSLAAIETRDNGKLLVEARTQLRYIPEWFRYFGGMADKIEGRLLPIDKPGMIAFTRREPLGVIAAILPWNSPLQLLCWKLAPLLAAGNTVVIKPSEHASASTLAFIGLFETAGFPPGVVNSVTGLPQETGAPLVAHPDVAKIAFTGGEPGGIAIYQSAAAALKPVTLELGGKSANIVFADADLDSAANGVVAGIFAAAGQTCIAGSRLLVERPIHDTLVKRIAALAASARIGDPSDLGSQIGPIATEEQWSRVKHYIEIAQSEGAEVVTGGTSPEGTGWFIEPTVLIKVRNDMRIAREEVFGPILSVIPFDDEEEAFTVANDSPYGLAAGLWTADMARTFRFAERLKAGTLWVNTYRAVSYMAPFGGYKRSGFGRENGQEAIDSYLQTKTVWIDPQARLANPFSIR